MLERKHKKTKCQANFIQNTTVFEKSCLKQVLLANFMDLRAACDGGRLEGGAAAFDKLGANGRIARAAAMAPCGRRAK